MKKAVTTQNLFGETVLTPLKEKDKPEYEGKKSGVQGNSPGEGGSVTGGADPWSSAHNGNSEHEAISRMVGVTLRIYPGEIQISYPKNHQRKKQKPPERRKGDITTFSRKSRLRLLRVYNRLHLIKLGDPIFITLTARPECFEEREKWLPSDWDHGAHNYIFRKDFLPMLKLIVPGLHYIWKMEPHKSGQAHYHLMVWSEHKARKLDSEFYKRKIRLLWRNCIDDHSRSAELYSCKVKAITSEKQAFNYISEYIMKEEPPETARIPGRRWGRSRELPISPITEVGIRMEAYEYIKRFCIELLKRRKTNTSSYIDKINSGEDWFIWLDQDTIVALLKRANRFAEASQYERFMKTGNKDPGNQELAEIAAEFGIDF